MGNIGTIALTAIITLVVTVLAGLAVEFFKRVKPKLKYSIKESVPIILDGKNIGANVIEISNPSSKSVKDIVLKIRAAGVDLKNGGVKTTTGLDYEVIEGDSNLEVKIPFLKFKDYLSITTILESRYSIPNKPNVTVRSPDTFKLIEEDDNNDGRRSFIKEFKFMPAMVAAFVVSVTLGFSFDTPGFTKGQGAIMSLSASAIGLPELAAHYVSNDGIYYYNQGPFVYSLAKSSNDPIKVNKYKDFLIKTTEITPFMVSRSKANFYFFIAKICLLQNRSKEAEAWFDKAREEQEDEFKKLEDIFRH
jgi:hypothetical protein